MVSELISEVIGRVFTPGAEVVWNANEVPPDDRFWVIPPRWIVPHDFRYGWPVLSQWYPYKVSSRVKWVALTTAYRKGCLGHIPGVVSVGVSVAACLNGGRLGRSNQQKLSPVIYVGTPGPTRKTVVTLVDMDTCRPSGVAKIPLNPGAAVSILREAENLSLLEREKPGLAPRLLFVDQELGVSTQEAVIGKSTGRRLTKAHFEWLIGLRNRSSTISLRDRAEQLMCKLERLDDTEKAKQDLMYRLLGEINDRDRLSSTWVHGDFAPWNLKWVDSTSLGAVDWEDARPNGLPLMDLLHFMYIQAYLFGAKTDIFHRLGRAPGFSKYLTIMEIDHQACRKLTLLYLIEMWLYRFQNDQHRHANFLLARIVDLQEKVS